MPMSQDERDLQFMRLTRQTRMSKETIARLEAKITLYFRDVQSASSATTSGVISITPHQDPDAIVAKLRDLPSLDSIIESLEEVKVERATLADGERMLASIQP